MSKEAVLQIETDDLQESTCTAVNNRIKSFATDIAFVHAFYVVALYEFDAVLESSQKEAKKYGIELPQLCTTSEDCAEAIKSLGASVSTAALERVVGIVKESPDEIALTVPHLLPFATPFICTYLMESSPGVSLAVPRFADVCAEKALKTAVAQECEHAVSEEKLEAVATLIPHVSHLGVFHVLRLAQAEKSHLLYDIAEMLSQSQVHSALDIAIRMHVSHFDNADDTELLAELLRNASKPARDASLLYVTRCELPRKKYLKRLSEYATVEGQKVAEQVA